MIKTLLVFALALILGSSSAYAGSKTTGKGKNGERISVSKTVLDAQGDLVVVKGRNFDERTGIYVALCILPKEGKKPNRCGGGFGSTDMGSASFWISSNPPEYGISLATPYKPGGYFKVKLNINSRIGKKDCRIVRCAITTRADHLSPSNRSLDIVVPVQFKK